MRSREGQRRPGSVRRTRRFLPGWIEPALENRLLLTAQVVPAATTLTLSPTNLPDDTINTSYNQTIKATGGSGGYTFAVTTGALPAGLTLDAGTGVISGKPTATGTSTFTITAADSNHDTGSQSYSVNVNSALSITTTSLPSAVINTAYTQTLATTGGTGTPTFAVTTGSLPAGMSLSKAGVLSGPATAKGEFKFTVTATDSAGATASEAYDFFVNQFTLTPTTLPSWTVNTLYTNQTILGSGGTSVAPYTYAVSNGSLPPGLSLAASTGILSGTPTATGPYNFTITATDSSTPTHQTASQAYSITINPAISITTTSLPPGTTNVPYTQTIVATGGTGALSYTVSSGSPPSGLSLTPGTNVLTGTVTTPGTSTFTISVSDSVGSIAKQNYSLTFSNPITFTTKSLPNTTVDQPYNQTLAATGGTGTLTYTVKTGKLPAGLSLSGAGVLSGTPTAPGTSSFTVVATDSAGDFGSEGFAITVNPALSITTTSLPNGAVGTVYNQQINGTGGTAPLSYSISTGSLPGGLTMSSGGAITGIPTTAGSTNFSVKVTDAAGLTATEPYTLTILPAGSATGPTVTSVVRNGVHRQKTTYTITFSTALDATSAENLSNYSIVPIHRTRLDGPAVRFASAVYNASNHTVTLTAYGNVALNKEYVLTINGTSPQGVKDTSGNNLAGLNGTAGSNYVRYFGPEILAGRKAQATFESKLVTSLTTAINQSSLTTGDVISIVSGVGAPGILQASDVPLAVRIQKLAHSPSPTVGAALDTVIQNLENPVSSSLAIAPTTLPNDTVGVAYNQTITASNGTAPYTYAVSSGNLPAGLNLDSSTGAITGTPTTAATSAFTVTATDSAGVTGSQPYSVTVNSALAFSTPTLQPAAVGSPYTRQLTVTGGTGTITYAVTTGSTPPGLSLSSSGLLSGTPTTTGTTNFTVTATDTVGATATQTYSLVVNPAIALTPPTLPDGTANGTYNQTITATGGAGGFTYTVTSGTLPSGLSLNNSTGVLGGTPTTAGTSNFTVTATDGSGSTLSQPYTLTINPAITFTTTSLPDGSIGTAYNQNVTATGGTGTLTYALTLGTLPPGLTLGTDGSITGTPTASSTYNFTVTATDTAKASQSQALSINIA